MYSTLILKETSVTYYNAVDKNAAQAYYNDAYKNIRLIDYATGENTVVVTADRKFFDIAHSDGTIYGVEPNGKIYTVDTTTGKSTLFADADMSLNGLAADSNGDLYAVSRNSDKLLKIDAHGNVTKLGWFGQSEGDIVVIDNAVYMTDTKKQLIKYDLDTDEVTTVAKDLANDLYGLAIGGNNELLAFEDDGDVWSIDLTTGKSSKIDHVDHKGDVNGAASIVDADNNPDPEPAIVDLIVNGSFEDVTGMKETGYGYVAKDGKIVGWTTSDGKEIDIHNDERGGQVAPDGENWLDLEASPGNIRIGQDVEGVIDNAKYQLEFSVSDSKHLAYSGSKENLVKVYWGGKLIKTIDPSNYKESEFETIKLELIGGAGDGSNRLEFEGLGKEDNFGAAIDKVRLYGPAAAKNQDPIANDDEAKGLEDTTLTIAIADLLANDTDPDGDKLYDFSVQHAVNGNVSIVGDTVEFYPDAGYAGPASFTYTITDGKGGFDTATVNLTIEAKVNEAPKAADDAFDAVEDTMLMTPVAELLANDVDPEGKPLSIVSVQDAVNGVVELVGDKVVFTPNADYNGPASYTYTITDGDKESTATVNLTVVAVNDNPIAADDHLGEFIEGQPIAINVADVLSNDSDPDGDAIRANAVIDTVGGHFAMVNGVPTFIPDAGFIGDARLTYQITDDKGGFDTATITFKMIADPNPNQNPDAQDDDLGNFVADQTVAIDVAQILSNDTDPDGDTLTPTAVVATQNGSFAMINGVPSFIPDAGFVGTASLTYQVEDGNGGSDTATIFFNFVPADQAPQAEDDMAEGKANNDLVIDPADLLANDVDPEGKPLTLVSVGNPVNGTVAIVGGQVIFTPDADYKGPASFTYVVADPAGNEGSATVNLAINDNTIYGTPNDDIPLNGTEGNDYINGLEGDDTINGLGGDDFIYGGPGEDTINAGDGDDTVLGGYADDRIEGGNGNDTINGNQGNDTLKGGEGNDTMSGSSGNDLLLGQGGDDTLYGDAGDDTLDGGDGNDILQGGQENDVLTGGLGADTFVWTGNDIQPHGNGRETDIVTDFNASEDKLDLADLLVNEQNSDNLDRYLDFNYDDSTGDTTIAVSSLGSFEKSDDSIDCQQLADQLIVLEGVDLTAGNTISDENIIQNMLNNNQLIVDSL